MHYDPDIAPDPVEWLALDEDERLQLTEEYHDEAGIDLPNVTAHACFHVMVENQIAEGLESVTRAMARLRKEGLSRHDALHAVASVLAEHIHELMTTEDKGAQNTSKARYDAAVERLTASGWRSRYGP